MIRLPPLPLQVIALVFLLALTLGVGALGSAVTLPSIGGWYAGLAKPPFNPPNWVFGPVWTLLYIVMAVAAWLAWRASPGTSLLRGARTAFLLYAIQLVLNLLWSVLFFGLRSPGAAVIELPVLIAAVAATALAFRHHSRPAAWLMAPYLAWLTYALVLNVSIWELNA
jgi:tryptophan-rich sensory protein